MITRFFPTVVDVDPVIVALHTIGVVFTIDDRHEHRASGILTPLRPSSSRPARSRRSRHSSATASPTG